jgi:2-oxoglutarate dehydrogenase E2 component (dihydrolipoamide succinyltransferase)
VDRRCDALAADDRHERTEENTMTEIRVPTLGESVTEATIGRWFKKAGDAVAVDEPLVELETDKVTIEVPAPSAGVLGEIAAKDGEPSRSARCSARSMTAPRAAAKPAAAPPSRAAAPAAAAAAAPRPEGAAADAPLAPSVRKLSAESGVDASTVPGSGKDGRVTKGDMLAAIERAGLRADPGQPARRRRPGRAPSPPMTPPAKSASR